MLRNAESGYLYCFDVHYIRTSVDYSPGLDINRGLPQLVCWSQIVVKQVLHGRGIIHKLK